MSAILPTSSVGSTQRLPKYESGHFDELFIEKFNEMQKCLRQTRLFLQGIQDNSEFDSIESLVNSCTEKIKKTIECAKQCRETEEELFNISIEIESIITILINAPGSDPNRKNPKINPIKALWAAYHYAMEIPLKEKKNEYLGTIANEFLTRNCPQHACAAIESTEDEQTISDLYVKFADRFLFEEKMVRFAFNKILHKISPEDRKERALRSFIGRLLRNEIIGMNEEEKFLLAFDVCKRLSNDKVKSTKDFACVDIIRIYAQKLDRKTLQYANAFRNLIVSEKRRDIANIEIIRGLIKEEKFKLAEQKVSRIQDESKKKLALEEIARGKKAKVNLGKRKLEQDPERFTKKRKLNSKDDK